MSPPRWLALLALYTLYLALGALVFRALEAPRSLQLAREREGAARGLRRRALEAVLPSSGPARAALLRFVAEAETVHESHILPLDFNASASDDSIRALINQTFLVPEVEDHNWSYWNTFFFTFITITTIGYGHISPKTVWGQQFCIVYSLFGIPLNTLVFVALASFYAERVLTTQDREGGGSRSYTALVLRALLYLLPGLLVFLVLPSIVVMLVEDDWTFLESFYFAFISLTTIGFGDFVAGHPSHYGSWDVLYKGYIMLWTMSGLGYIIMVVTFLMDAFKSKPIIEAQKRTEKLLKKRTERLQKALQSLVQQHNFQHGKDKKDLGPGQANGGFIAELPDHVRAEIYPQLDDLPEWSQDSSTLKMVDGLQAEQRQVEVDDTLPEKSAFGPHRIQRQISRSMPSRYKKGGGKDEDCDKEAKKNGVRRRASVHVDDVCCKDLKTLVELVDAVEEMVEDSMIFGKKGEDIDGGCDSREIEMEQRSGF